MEKKIYEKPAMQMELFVPNHYAAACANPNEWVAKCRSTSEGSCLIFYGGGENGPDNWVSDACRGGCGQEHKFTWEGTEPPGANCWLITNVKGHGTGRNAYVTPTQYQQYFETTSSTTGLDGSGLRLTEAGQEFFRNQGTLVPGFYYRLPNGFNWLVTDDLIHIHPAS